MVNSINIINETVVIKDRCYANYEENKAYCEDMGVNLLTYSVFKEPNHSVIVNLEFFLDLDPEMQQYLIESIKEGNSKFKVLFEPPTNKITQEVIFDSKLRLPQIVLRSEE